MANIHFIPNTLTNLMLNSIICLDINYSINSFLGFHYNECVFEVL